MATPMAVAISSMQMDHISKGHLDSVKQIVMMDYLFTLMDHLKEGKSEIQNLTEKPPSTINKMEWCTRVSGRKISLMAMAKKSMMMKVTTKAPFSKEKKTVRIVNLSGEMAKYIGVPLKTD